MTGHDGSACSLKREPLLALSSKVESGSREENASDQNLETFIVSVKR
jgi:hypothetical protein